MACRSAQRDRTSVLARLGRPSWSPTRTSRTGGYVSSSVMPAGHASREEPGGGGLRGVVHDAVVAAAGSCVAGAGAVAAEHLRGGPPVQLHEVALGAAAVEPGMAEVMPEPVREYLDAALASPAGR